MLKCSLFFLLMMSTVALANDSVAEMGAGGLILVRADGVTMQSEDLFVSPSQVRVDYEFRNDAKETQNYLVAFPMPMIDPEVYLNSDTSVPKPEQDNFMDFQLTVEGKPVATQLEMRALSGGLDVTDELKALSIPLNPMAEATRGFVSRLPVAKIDGLVKKGAILVEDGGATPSWALKSTYYWNQDFPANAILHVSHKYIPAVGAAFYSELPDIVARDEKTYCVDSSARAAISGKLKTVSTDQPFLNEKTLQYILTTGANWSGAIENFRLVVDKENPAALVSFCMDGVTKIGPTTFEVKKKDFTPDKELDVLILSEMPKN